MIILPDNWYWLSNKQMQIICKFWIFFVKFNCLFILSLCLRSSDLKSQYAEQQTSGTNINELPQLLQSIHSLKPTVFKTGGQQLHIRQSL